MRAWPRGRIRPTHGLTIRERLVAAKGLSRLHGEPPPTAWNKQQLVAFLRTAGLNLPMGEEKEGNQTRAIVVAILVAGLLIAGAILYVSRGDSEGECLDLTERFQEAVTAGDPILMTEILQRKESLGCE